jgi:hypothetical protein
MVRATSKPQEISTMKAELFIDVSFQEQREWKGNPLAL